MKITDYYNSASEDVLLFLEDLDDQMNNSEFLKNNLTERMVYFTQYVNRLHEGSYSYLEAISEFCISHDISHDDVQKLISDEMKANLYIECVKNNMIKDDEQLGNIGL
jgi:hypothetical protein